jgi:branched-chain amino acid transport system permease protein
MIRDRRILIILALVLIVLPWLMPNRYYLTIAVLIGIYALITIGLNLLIGFAGQISLGHAAFYGLGAYMAAILATQAHWPTFPALIAGAFFAALIAWIIGRPTLKLQGHYLAMATLGFGMIVYIFMEELAELTGGPQGLTNIPKLDILGFSFSDDFRVYFLIWGLVIVAQWMVLNLLRGRTGRAFMAIHANEPAAASLGLDTAALKLTVFVISAAMAGLAGGIYAFSINYISPEPFGFHFSILLVTMVIIGGMGDSWGPILGTVLLGVLPELLRVFKDFDILIYGLMLMVIIIFLPKGLIALLYGIRLPFRRKGGRTA